MDRNHATQKFRSIVANVLEIPEADITDTKTFKALGADAMAIDSIHLRTEEAFDIASSDTLFDGIDTVGKAIDMIVKKA